MNILIPDSWLREYLETKATPKQIKKYLSLCGPSVERIHKVNGEIVYDVEITTNRPDSMSILGVAREAAAILPRFGIEAKLVKDPYSNNFKFQISNFKLNKKLTIKTDPTLNPRWVSVVIDHVSVKPSPEWLTKRLEFTGIRPLNTVVDVTNYFMRAYGQPAHAFDYDEIKEKDGIPTMTLRASKKGEKLTTLDGKDRILPGGDIVIEDGSGRLIDLAGIMGGQNSSIKNTTKTIVLFMQTYNPVRIRRTSMALSHRTEAATLFEKGLDSELVLPTIIDAAKMLKEIAGGEIASELSDLYPQPFQPYTVSTSRKKLDAYLGKHLDDNELVNILTPLGFMCEIVIPGLTRNPSSSNTGSRLVGRDDIIRVTVPSFRRDIEIDVDVIEEVARIYGYHNIVAKLPEGEIPLTTPDKALAWEEEVKTRLRDWGFTETYTYSMISEELMDIFGLDKAKAYKISNPLSEEWVYMRPTLWPSMLAAIKQNLNIKKDLKLFELSMVYLHQEHDLPRETPVLIVILTGNKFREAKGIGEAIYALFGLSLPEPPTKEPKLHYWDNKLRLLLGENGAVSEVNQKLLNKLGINEPVTIFWTHFDALVTHAKPTKKYSPIPKYPPVIEDLTFVFPKNTPIGNVLAQIKNTSPFVYLVNLKDQFDQAFTFRVNYLDQDKPLTAALVENTRKQIVNAIEKKFNGKLKG